MAVSDNKQRFMPSPDDVLPSCCEKLAYPEAVKLKTPTNSCFQGGSRTHKNDCMLPCG